MKTIRFTVVMTCLAVAACRLAAWAADGPAVNESAREIPIACEVDVVVVGGGTGAVASAVAAAESGARVFLAAPYPYLGDDMTATLRLGLAEGEAPVHPLARKIYLGDPFPSVPTHNALAFTYVADRASAALHPDTDPPSLLTDGRWGNAATQSVQYDGDVVITADLGTREELEQVRVVVYCREASNTAGSGFNVQSVTVSVSDDGQAWRAVAELPGQASSGEEYYVLAADIDASARYVRLAVKKPDRFARVLLGEFEILSAERADGAVPPPPRPMHVKKTLDEALLAAGVPYLYSCLVTDVLRDAAGQPAGIVMANRAGRQAVVAKAIIDATDRAQVARLAGAEFVGCPAGETQQFQRTVIGGTVRTGPGLSARVIEPPFVGQPPADSGTAYPVIEYTLDLPIVEPGYAAWMKLDQQCRTLTYDPDQQYSSDSLFQIPPEAVRGRAAASGAWAGVDPLPLGAFQPANVPRVYVLGGYADLPREHAARLLRPLALMDLGTRLGAAAAREALSTDKLAGVRLPGTTTDHPAAAGDVRESLSGIRPIGTAATVPQDARAVPVLGRYDILVIGGGPAGASAGIAAARRGARVLVVESLCGLGGAGTEGAISSYYWGHRVGFTATVLDGATSWPIEPKKEWWRRALLDAGGELWFATIGCGALVDEQRVCGAVVATPFGRGVLLADVVIDGTGNCDIAAAAGAETMYTDASEFGMQGTGLPGRQLGGSYNNTDFAIVDETDMVDVWQTFVYAKGKYADAFDQSRMIDTRERRRIVGDAIITLVDQMNQRTYPDTICRAWSNFDTHGYTIDPYTFIEHPEQRGFYADIPYRALLPRGLDGILVIGLGISAHRDAVPLIRMQPDIQNGGYAAGVAAAMASQGRTSLRRIDLQALKEHLVEVGNLPPEVLAHRDSYPMPSAAIAEAVRSIPQGRGAAVVLAHPAQALPLVQDAFAGAEGDAKLVYARLLAVLGDSTGLDTMLARLRATPAWDEGWNYRAMGQFGVAYSKLDELLVCIGATRSHAAVPAILEKVALLSAADAFSHHRAVGRALELIGDPAAARPLAALLAQPGISGHHQHDIATAIQREVPGGTNAETTRRESLRELLLARALYRCGDHDGVGRRILENYARDLRGHLARHAQAVLEEQPAHTGR